jgi:tetratricopeptide (TPR) repeat protein
MPLPPLPDDPARELRTLVEAGRFREALDAHRRGGDPADRTRPEVALLAATAATRLGELTTGVTLAESALERFRARADTDGRMRAMNLLGAIAFEQGRLEEAERCFGEALELARTADDTRMEANASNNLASVAHLRNQSDIALSLYRTALLAYQRLGDRRGTAQTYHNLGIAFREQAAWEDAENAAIQAVRHAEQVGEGSLLALTTMGRAELHLEGGDYEMARTELARAGGHARRAHDDIGLAEVTRLEALLALHEERFDAALPLALEARAAAIRLGALQLQGECAALAARAQSALGRKAEAEASRAEARKIFDALGAERLSQGLD